VEDAVRVEAEDLEADAAEAAAVVAAGINII
jgi:hypothetical protein